MQPHEATAVSIGRRFSRRFPMFAKSCLALSVVALTAVASTAAFTTPAIDAAPGSRMCGWTLNVSPKPGVIVQAVGILLENRKENIGAGEVCREAISKIKEGIKKDPNLAKYGFDESGNNALMNVWVKQSSDTCESVGKMFTNTTTHTSIDMCDSMKASNKDHQTTYQVVKTNFTVNADNTLTPVNPATVVYTKM